MIYLKRERHRRRKIIRLPQPECFIQVIEEIARRIKDLSFQADR